MTSIDPAQATPGDSSLSRVTILTYCLPTLGVGFLSMPFSIWLMKFSTDELLMAPAAFGTLLMLGRVWDAVSDPLAGVVDARGCTLRRFLRPAPR
jgi:GPH family glycoside/pentoside/hexuronide:cation symporter